MIYNKILAYAFFMVGIISIIASKIYERKRKPFTALKYSILGMYDTFGLLFSLI